MMFVIRFYDKNNVEHSFVTKDGEYVRLAFESFMQDDDVVYVSFEIMEEK